MTNIKQTQSADIELNKLEHRVEDLVSVVSKLKEENNSLNASRPPSLAAERSRLQEKNETVRVRIEAMISRLKAMEK